MAVIDFWAANSGSRGRSSSSFIPREIPGERVSCPLSRRERVRVRGRVAAFAGISHRARFALIPTLSRREREKAAVAARVPVRCPLLAREGIGSSTGSGRYA
jgi:hypothetical protein